MPLTRFAPNRFTIGRKVMLGFGALLALYAIIAVVSWRSTVIFFRSSEQVAHAHDVIEGVEQARRQLMDMESVRRGFLLTGEPRWLPMFENAGTQLEASIERIRNLTKDEPAQAERVAGLERLLAQSRHLQAMEIEARERGAPPALELFKQHASENLTAKIEGELDQFEIVHQRTLKERRDGTRAVVQSTLASLVAGTVLTFAALIGGASMILRDIAARRRAEEALAAERNLLSSIMDAMPNHVFLKDARGRFILDNAAHRRYLRLAENESIEGRTVADYFPAPVAETMREADQQVIDSGEPILNREIFVACEGGADNWLEISKVALRDTDGRIIGVVGVSSDISQRKAAEEQLVRFAAQLERSNAELQNFASVASHDLQEPLRKIQAFGDRLKARCADQIGEYGRDYLARMQNAAERMRVLIQDLLKLSRVTSRAQPFEACDLTKILKEVLGDLEVAIENRGARVGVGALPTIDADPLQMRQLFQNLVSNALKFHKPGEPPQVEVAGRTFEPGESVIAGAKTGERVCEITVRDHGIGFDQKFADQIFVVFQRLHSRAEYEGTGIGLAVCRKITDRHGGRIVAQSSAGEGATFVVTLPVKQPAAEIHEPQRSDADHDPDGR